MDKSAEIDQLLNQYVEEKSNDSQTEEFVNFVLSEIIEGNVSIDDDHDDQPVIVTRQNTNHNNQRPLPDPPVAQLASPVAQLASPVAQLASPSVFSQASVNRNAAAADLGLDVISRAIPRPLTATVEMAGKKVIIPLGQFQVPATTGNGLFSGIQVTATGNVPMRSQVPAATNLHTRPQVVTAAANISMGPQVPAATNFHAEPQVPPPAAEENPSSSTTNPPVAESLPPATAAEEVPLGSKKRKLYEEDEFEDPQMEKKRKNAINAKNHRLKTKQLIEDLNRQLREIESERDVFKVENESFKAETQQLREDLAEALRREQERQALVREITSLREENARLRQQGHDMMQQHRQEDEEQQMQQDKIGVTQFFDFFPDDFFNF